MQPRKAEPIQVQAVERYFAALDQGMTPKEASEVFKPINGFLYDWIQLYGTAPKGLERSTSILAVTAAQKVGQ